MAETKNNNLQVAEEPEFTRNIPGIDPNDPVHFAQMNGILEKLLGNDVFLDKLANKMIEKNLIAHVLDCENAQMVLGADQAPMITGLIDGVKEDVTQLYSDIQKAPILIIPTHITIPQGQGSGYGNITFNIEQKEGYAPIFAIYGWQNYDAHIYAYTQADIINKDQTTVTMSVTSRPAGAMFVTYILYVRT